MLFLKKRDYFVLFYLTEQKEKFYYKSMKKFDTHVHNSPVSVCGRLNAEQIVKKYHDCNFDGFMLTNHYSRAYIEKYNVSEKEWLDRYIEAYHETRKEGEKYGMEIFLGAEVSLYAPYSKYMRDRYSEEVLRENYADYLLFGVTEKFLKTTPMLCDLTLPELKEICNKNGVYVVQAHPFRFEQHHTLKDPKYLDGVEINGNCAFSLEGVSKAIETAKKYNLFCSVGGDTHYDWHKLQTAIFIPDEIHDSVALGNYLNEVRMPEYSITEKDENAAPRP